MKDIENDPQAKEVKRQVETDPQGGRIGDFTKDLQKKFKEVRKEPMKKAIVPAFKRTFLTKDKGVRGVVSKVVKNPVGTAIAAGIAKDAFRGIPLPPLPVVQGGKVGKRTAG